MPQGEQSPSTPSSTTGKNAPMDPKEIARRVAERVWQLMREELRREGERQGTVRRG